MLTTGIKRPYYSQTPHERKGNTSTFDVDKAVEESNRFEGEEVSQVLHADFERVPVVQLQVGVHRETQVFLDLLTQLVQQVLWQVKKKEWGGQRFDLN